MEHRIAQARERDPRLELVAGDAARLPWEARELRSRDPVHVRKLGARRRAAVGDRRRDVAVLRPGGTLVSYDMTGTPVAVRAFRRAAALRRRGAPPAGTSTTPIDEAELHRLFPGAGFRLRRITPSTHVAGFADRNRVLAALAASLPLVRSTSSASRASPAERSGEQLAIQPRDVPELILATHRRHCQRVRHGPAAPPPPGRRAAARGPRRRRRRRPARATRSAVAERLARPRQVGHDGGRGAGERLPHAARRRVAGGDRAYASAARYRSARRSSSTKPTTWTAPASSGSPRRDASASGSSAPGCLSTSRASGTRRRSRLNASRSTSGL